MSDQCPVRHDFTMLDPAFVSDPYATCPIVQESPVFFSPDLGCYVITRYADVEKILSDHVRFSNAATNVPVTPINEEAQKVLNESEVWFRPNLTNADAPRHTMVRRWVADAMSPRRIRALEPGVREWASAKIDGMIAKGTADIYEELCFPLPAITGFTLIGFPKEDVERLKSWCDRRVVLTYGRATGAEQVEVAENVAAFWRYTNEFVKSRIDDPQDDLTSDIIQHHLADPEEFSLRDVSAVLFGLSIAAHETTTNLMTNGVRQLLTHRDQWEALVDDPSLIANTIEECLRFDGPVIGWRRRTTEDVDVSGTLIPKDSVVLMLLYSANHDPRRFEGAESLDIRRKDARYHLTFGKGTHFCAGAPMARMEMRILLENLIEKSPGMRLVEHQSLEFTPNISQRGPHGLLVDFVPDRALVLS